MGKRRITHFALPSATCILALSALTAIAQDTDEGGVLLTFGIEQRFEVGRNIALEVPEEGTSSVATTTLSFGLSSETRTQRISIEGSSGLRISDLPGEGTDVGFSDTELRLEYGQDVGNSAFTATAEYTHSDIDFLRSLSDFEDDDGVIVLPPDFDDLTGGGTRQEYDVELGLELGRENMLGFNLTAGASGVDYSGTTDPDLFQTRTTSLGLETILRFSEVTTGIIGLSAEQYDAENAEMTDRLTSEITFGIEHEISPRARVDASIGYSVIDTEELISGDTRTTGLIWHLGAEYDMPNGVLTAEFDSSRDTAGRLRTFRIGRSLEIPDGTLSGSIGVADIPGGSTEIIGDLSWRQELGPNEIIAEISRSVSTSTDDESRATTTAGIGYVWGLSPLSSVRFNVAYALTDGTATEAEVERTDLSAVYRRALTPDWNLNTGVIYRTRDEEGVGRAESPSIFVSVDRQFSVRP